MAEKVGELYYDVTLDTAQMVAGQRKVDAAVRATTGSLDQFGGKLSQTAQAARIHVVSTTVAAEATKKLDAATKKTSDSLDKTAMSAKALSAATRGIPAQFTDIVTGLASGQRPLQVLMQQGGQLKDMFGGIGPAAKALGGYVMGMVSPLTLGAAAAAALVVGFVKGRDETAGFAKTLELGGNKAGITADQLNVLAQRMDSMAGVTRGEAAAALTVFVAAGARGATEIGKFTEAALMLEKAGGPAIEDTAKAFQDLQNAPLQASLRLNDSVNFLTESVYRQIRSLEQQGKFAEAAKVAQNAYADAISSRAPKVMENLGLMERGWRAITGAIKEAGDAMLNIGRKDTPEQAIAATRAKIAALQNQIDTGGFATTAGGAAVGRGLTPNELAQKKAEVAALQEQVRLYGRAQSAAENSAQADEKRADKLKALAEFDQAGERFLTQRAQMEREITLARNLGVAAGLSEEQIEKRILAIRRSYSGISAKSDAARAYYEGLVAENASGLAKINEQEKKALTENQGRMAQDWENAGVYQRARVEIVRKYARERAQLEEKTSQEIADLNIAITIDETAKIEAARAEEFRRADAAVKLGTKTFEEGERAKTLAAFQAAQATADLAERNARARAASTLTQTKSQEQRILQIRDEAVRQAEEAYRRGKATFEEMEASKVEAAVRAADDLKALQTSRSKTVVDTLQIRADTSGNLDDQVALVRAQAEAQLAAVQEAQLRDLEQTQIYADQKAAIIAAMNQKILELNAASANAQLSAAGSAAGQLVELLQKTGRERTVLARAAFLAEKAFAVAQIIVSTEVAAAKAGEQLGIFGLPMAAVIRASGYASAGLVAGMAVGEAAGGRRYGGPVSAGSLYRVNEDGAPEMFTSGAGKQYMMATRSGQVTPADQVAGGVHWTINVHNAPPGTSVGVDQQARTIDVAVARAVGEVAGQISSNTGPVWTAMRGTTNVKGRM